MYDIFIIGGGINGCGIARDASGRGYSVCLAEMNDLGSGTSSWSTKLIHGGLRYLEHYEFRLVRESLIERERLWALAPHIISAARFVLPHHKGLRPKWLLRLGLFLYDHLGGRKLLPATSVLNLETDEAGKPLKDEYKTAFEYSDCRVDDARLVILNAMDAAGHGGDIRPQTRVVRARREAGHWEITMENRLSGKTSTVSARMLINAAGPWVDEVLGHALGSNNPANVRLVRGSHIVIKKKFDHERSYFFQNADERIFFAIPYEDDFTLIGTTDQDHEGDAGDVSISDKEIDYLCEGASAYFKEPVTPDDIVWTFSGLRPLYDDGASKAQEATRDYVLKKEEGVSGAPFINIFGGKITTYRKLANAMLDLIGTELGEKGTEWTADKALPGGNFPVTGRQQLSDTLAARYPFVDQKLMKRLVRTYGTLVGELMGDAKGIADMGQDFGHGLHEREVRYLIAHEWATCADDVLWRRTKLGIRFSKQEKAILEAFVQANRTNDNAASLI